MLCSGLGKQYLVDYYGCCSLTLNNLKNIREAMVGAARVSHATIIKELFHEYNPQGLSGVLVIAESHIAIHTWPEHNTASLDIFSCGTKMLPLLGIEYLRIALKARDQKIFEVTRGGNKSATSADLFR